jgi:hypothetical protein
MRCVMQETVTQIIQSLYYALLNKLISFSDSADRGRSIIRVKETVVH